MNVVAERAVKFAVLARVLAQFLDLRGVAGQARVGYIVAELDDLRGVRVCVTTHATFQRKVRFPFVTHAAFRDDLFHGRRMADVTVLASDVGFVSPTVGSDICGRFCMALNTVRAC